MDMQADRSLIEFDGANRANNHSQMHPESVHDVCYRPSGGNLAGDHEETDT